MLFLGIDQSLNGTGLCMISDQGIVLGLGTVTQDARDGDRRLVEIRARIDAMLPVTGAAMEGYSFDSPHRAFDLGEVAGVVKCLLVERGVPFVVVPPSTLKKFATGVSSASKDEMLGAARQFDAAVEDDNQADALFLARVARALVHGCTKRCELEALKSLRETTPKRRPRRVRRLVQNAI